MTTRAATRPLLLIESDDERSPFLEAALDDAGFEIRRCVEPGAASFPCVALTGGPCPLDDGTVAVALDVRKHPWPHPTQREGGVQCALRQHVPLVVADRGARHPFREWATVTVNTIEAAPAACERAIEHRLDEVRSAVRTEVAAVLRRHGVDDPEVTVVAERVGGALHLRVTAPVPPNARTAVSARAGRVARLADTVASTIEIELVNGARS